MTDPLDIADVAVEQVAASPSRRHYSEYRATDIEWLGDIPNHWELDRLKWTVVGCKNGTWGSEPDGENDIACVRVADFDRTRFRVQLDEPTLRAVPAKDRNGRQLGAGDLLLEKSGGGELQPVGAVMLYDHDKDAVCSNFIARMPPASGFDSRFLTYLNAHLYSGRVNVRSIKQTTGIQNLDSQSYLDERVPYPPLDEQRAIAAFLDRETAKIDALVANKERLIELLQEKRTALISHAVTKGLNPDAKMKDSGIEWLGTVPAHWEVLRFRRYIVAIEQGWSPVAEQRLASRDEWAVIKVGAVYKGRFREDEHKAFGENTEPERRFEIHKGDFLITRGNTPELVADTCIVSKCRPRLMLSDLHYRVRTDGERLLSTFACFWLLSRAGRVQIEADARGTSGSMVKVSQGHIRNWTVCCPPIAEQAKIVAFIEKESRTLGFAISKVEDAVERLSEYRTALISAAVTGKIDVRGGS